MLLLESMSAERVDQRKHADRLLGQIMNRGTGAGPDRDTWGLLPHQIAAAEQAMRTVPG